MKLSEIKPIKPKPAIKPKKPLKPRKLLKPTIIINTKLDKTDEN